MNMIEAVENFVFDCLDFYSGSTLMTYEYYIRYFMRYFPEIQDIDNLDHDTLIQWKLKLPNLQTLHAPDGSKPATVKLALDSLEALYDYLKDEELILINPVTVIKRPKISLDLPKVVDSYSLHKFKEAVRSHKRNASILSTFLDTGLRVGELVNLKKCHYDNKLSELFIHSTKSHEDRTGYLTFESMARLDSYLNSRKDDNPYLFVNQFGKCLSTMGVREMLKTYSILAGLKKEKIILPHDLRKSFATDLYVRGIKIEEISVLLVSLCDVID